MCTSIKNTRWQTILLVGPTGSGKTPFGQLLEQEGLRGKRCVHFDFGQALRTSATSPQGLLTDTEFQVVENVLKAGVLLEDEHFPLARKLLNTFLSKRNAGVDTLVVLNGLPRHVGQAQAMEAVIDMQTVVSLECKPEIAWERVRVNAGGDRGDRTDDTLEKVRKRINTFNERTAPLLKYYHERGVPVLPVDVGVKTSAEEMRSWLEDRQPHT